MFSHESIRGFLKKFCQSEPKTERFSDYMSREKIQNLPKKLIKWPTLAFVDAKLVSQLVEDNDVHGHKIEADVPKDDDQVDAIENFLLGEYNQSLKLMNYKPVSYLPTSQFTPLGVFSKIKIVKDSYIPGLTGLLGEMSGADIRTGVNDSLIESKLLRKTWLMLGPVSFVNASCRPNARFERNNLIMKSLAVRDIEIGEEILIDYDRQYFGEFNVDCLCPHKSKHGRPFPEALGVQKCRRKPQKPTIKAKEVRLSNHEISSRFSQISDSESSSGYEDNNGDISEHACSYEVLYNDIDNMPHFSAAFNNLKPQNCVPQSKKSVKNENPEVFPTYAPQLSDNQNLNSSITDLTLLNPLLNSTPLRLCDFECGNNETLLTTIDMENKSQYIEPTIPLYDGSQVTLSYFKNYFDKITLKHKLSEAAKKDHEKIISFCLPVSNNFKDLAPALDLPQFVKYDLDNSVLICIDVVDQLQKTILTNISYVQSSWRFDCSWSVPTDNFVQNEVQLVINIDGASVFSSRNLSLWPVWVQLYNLPPNMRSSYKNISLLCLLYGSKKKPNLMRFFLR